MFIKYEESIDNAIIYVPDSVMWQICVRSYDHEEDHDDYNLYLIVGDKTICLRDTNALCMGRKNLPYWIVGELHQEIVNVICSKLENDPSLRVIDITLIENELLETRFEKEWFGKGYIEIGHDGHW